MGRITSTVWEGSVQPTVILKPWNLAGVLLRSQSVPDLFWTQLFMLVCYGKRIGSVYEILYYNMTNIQISFARLIIPSDRPVGAVSETGCHIKVRQWSIICTHAFLDAIVVNDMIVVIDFNPRALSHNCI